MGVDKPAGEFPELVESPATVDSTVCECKNGISVVEIETGGVYGRWPL